MNNSNKIILVITLMIFLLNTYFCNGSEKETFGENESKNCLCQPNLADKYDKIRNSIVYIENEHNDLYSIGIKWGEYIVTLINWLGNDSLDNLFIYYNSNKKFKLKIIGKKRNITVLRMDVKNIKPYTLDYLDYLDHLNDLNIGDPVIIFNNLGSGSKFLIPNIFSTGNISNIIDNNYVDLLPDYKKIHLKKYFKNYENKAIKTNFINEGIVFNDKGDFLGFNALLTDSIKNTISNIYYQKVKILIPVDFIKSIVLNITNTGGD